MHNKLQKQYSDIFMFFFSCFLLFFFFFFFFFRFLFSLAVLVVSNLFLLIEMRTGKKTVPKLKRERKDR